MSEQASIAELGLNAAEQRAVAAVGLIKSAREVRYIQQDGKLETREQIKPTIEQKIDIALYAVEAALLLLLNRKDS